MSDNLIIIFTRNPELGKVKTRLAQAIGNEAALNIYKFLLEHTEKTIRTIDCDKAIYYSEKVRYEDLWDNAIFEKYLQQGTDLGDRMLNAFQSGFHNGYKKLIIVGSDLPDLSMAHINTAIKKLNDYDVVIGPAKDGGYYLLGLNTLLPQLFQNKAWGTSSVLSDTLADLTNETVFLLEELNDIDTLEDIENKDIFKEFIVKDD